MHWSPIEAEVTYKVKKKTYTSTTLNDLNRDEWYECKSHQYQNQQK